MKVSTSVQKLAQVYKS